MELSDDEKNLGVQIDRVEIRVAGNLRKIPRKIMIWGSRGSCKSTLIRALIGKYFARGLRAVEITPSHYERLPDLFALVRGRCR